MAIPRMQYTAVVIKGQRERHALALPLANLGRAACGKKSKRWIVSTIRDGHVTCADCKLALHLPCRRRVRSRR